MSEVLFVSSARSTLSKGLPSNYFDAKLREAETCLNNEDWGGCYHFLGGAIRQRIEAGGIEEREVAPLCKMILQFQEALFEHATCEEMRKWLFPNDQGLIGELVNHLKKQFQQSLATEVCNLLQLGADHLGAKQLEKEFLEAALFLTHRIGDHDQERKNAARLGLLYLDHADTLPDDTCFKEGYQKGCLCLNAASKYGHKVRLSVVEQRYFERMSSESETEKEWSAWAEDAIFPDGSAEQVCHVVQVAERLIAYGRPKLGRALYFQADTYCGRSPFEGSKAIRTRCHELGDIKAIKPDNRSTLTDQQTLHGIRQLTTDLMLNGKVTQPNVSPYFLPTLLRCLKECGLGLDVEANLNVHQIQQLHGRLMTAFMKSLYTQAMQLIGPPPDKSIYSLVGFGSLSRGEMTLCSDLDAVVLVNDDRPEVIAYFKRVSALFELFVMNLGETKSKNFYHFSPLSDGFCLDPAELNPHQMIVTPKQLIDRQGDQELGLEALVNPIPNGLRFPCYIAGSRDLYDDYLASLHVVLKKRRSALQQVLFRRWKAPSSFSENFNAKKGLYYPIVFLIDALSIKQGIPQIRTGDRITALQKILPPSLIDLLRRGLKLACQLRMHVQIHYGEEKETIHTDPEEKAYLLSYSDRETLEEINTLLLQPLRAMTLEKGIDLHALREARIAYAEKLLGQERVERASAILAPLKNPPALLAASIALWKGEFKLANSLYNQGHLGTDLIYESCYRHALDSHTPLPKVPGLNALAGRLHRFQERTYRPIIHNPPKPLFKGSAQNRSYHLWHYLTKLPLYGKGKEIAWKHAYDCLCTPKLLPVDEHALLETLLPIKIEDPTYTDLAYADLIKQLRALFDKTHDPQVYHYLFHLFPPEMQKRFLVELKASLLNPALHDELAHFPQPDGSRPFLKAELSTWNVRNFAGDSTTTLQVVGGDPFTLSKSAHATMVSLIKGERSEGDFGRHPTKRLEDTHFKIYPEFLGREVTYLSLRRFVTGSSFPDKQLCKLSISKHSYPISAATYVPGENLVHVLEKTPQIKNLDFHHYFWEVVMTLLGVHEDANPEDLKVYEPPNSDLVQLIDVDADRVFFTAMKQILLGRTIQCKSILFCLDQMKQPIDPSDRAEFLALNPALFFGFWLQETRKHNTGCEKLFSEADIDKFLKRRPSACVLPFFLEPTEIDKNTGAIDKHGFLLQLYQRFQSLQEALRSDQVITLLDLLLKVEEDLGPLYEAELKTDKTALKRWLDLTEGHYDRAKGSIISATSSRLLPKYSSLKKYREKGWTADSALQDLNAIIAANTSHETLLDDLVHNGARILHTLNDPEFSKNTDFSERFNRLLEDIDFSQYTPELQNQILKRITGIKFTRLRIVGCTVLINRKLQPILRHCPHLTELDLTDSKGVVAPAYLEELCPKLKKLNLSGVSTLTTLSNDGIFSRAPLVLPALEWLDISHCQSKRVALTVASLKTLRCRGNDLPDEFELSCKKLEMLAVDTEKNLERLYRLYQPTTIYFGQAKITRLNGFDPSKQTNLTSIARDGRLILYRKGPESKAEKLAIALGLDEFMIVDRSQETKTVVQPMILKEETIIAITKLCPNLSALDLSWNRRLKDESVIAIAEHCPNLTYLNFSECERLSDKAIIAIAEHCPNLTNLNLTECRQVSSEAIITVAKHCPNLTNLNLKHTGRDSDEMIIAIAEHCHKLTNLNLHGYYKLSDRAIIAIAEHCPSLTSLTLTGCDQLTDKAIIAIAKHCPNLTDLTLWRCELLTNKAIIAIAGHCPNLTNLNLSGCKQLSDEAIIAIAKHCPNLINLNLNGCKQLSQRAFNALARYCHKLTNLSLSIPDCEQLSDEAIIAIAERCHKLTILNLTECKQLSDEAVIAVAKKCHNLTYLGLGRCTQLSDEAIIAVAKHRPNLTYLDLTGCKQLSDEAIIAIAEHCPNLTNLFLGGCEQISDKAIIAVAEHCPNLTLLNLRYNRQLSDRAIIAIAEHCPNLTRLELSDLHKVSDEGIIAIAEHCHKLTILILHGHDKLSDRAIIAIAEHCPSLTSLSLERCKQLSDKAIRAIIQHCPNLCFLYAGGLYKISEKVKNLALRNVARIMWG